MDIIKKHDLAIKLLQCIERAERIKTTRLENMETARLCCYPVAYQHYKEQVKLSYGCIERLVSRYHRLLNELERF